MRGGKRERGEGVREGERGERREGKGAERNTNSLHGHMSMSINSPSKPSPSISPILSTFMPNRPLSTFPVSIIGSEERFPCNGLDNKRGQ